MKLDKWTLELVQLCQEQKIQKRNCFKVRTTLAAENPKTKLDEWTKELVQPFQEHKIQKQKWINRV